MGEYGDAYRGSRARLTALAGQLDETALTKTVPTCPDWRVKDVLGHLIGLAVDVAAGNVEGAGSDEWTRRQVDDRHDRSGAELIAEWDTVGPGIEAMLDDASPALGASIVGDLATHELDVYGAFERADGRDTDAAALAFARYARSLGNRITKAGLPPLRLKTPEDDIVAGDGLPEAEVAAGRFELLRALTGRRSPDQVLAFKWNGDPKPYLAIFSAYGVPSAPVIE